MRRRLRTVQMTLDAELLAAVDMTEQLWVE